MTSRSSDIIFLCILNFTFCIIDKHLQITKLQGWQRFFNINLLFATVMHEFVEVGYYEHSI